MEFDYFLSQLGVLTRRLLNIPKWKKNETSIEEQCYTARGMIDLSGELYEP